jgi:hypothetical protein
MKKAAEFIFSCMVLGIHENNLTASGVCIGVQNKKTALIKLQIQILNDCKNIDCK